MSIVMVLHAEGVGEVGHSTYGTLPRESLLEGDLGPAHVLVRRVIEAEKGIPPEAVDFREPLRTKTGAHAHGSALLKPAILDAILGAWLDPVLVVLLVDADDKPHAVRLKILRDALSRNGMTGAVGVAIREFESWLIADPGALKEVFGTSKNPPVDIEKMDLRQAKTLLNSWVGEVANELRPAHTVRRQLAATIDLEKLCERCTSFRDFQKEIAALTM